MKIIEVKQGMNLEDISKGDILSFMSDDGTTKKELVHLVSPPLNIIITMLREQGLTRGLVNYHMYALSNNGILEHEGSKLYVKEQRSYTQLEEMGL